MNRIKLEKGIIAIGGSSRNEAPNFSMKLANHLAKTEKVLFLTYLSYIKKVKHDIESMDGSVEPNLLIEDSLNRFNVESFLKIISLIKENSINTVFIDDMETYIGNGYTIDTIFEERNESVVDAFIYLFKNYGVRIVFNVVFSTDRDNAFMFDGTIPTISCFTWNRRMISTCSEVYIVYRPAENGIIEDESGRSLKDCIRILWIKNANCRDITIELDNKELNIYPDTKDNNFSESFNSSVNPEYSNTNGSTLNNLDEQ
jgi:hypothetical protein